MVIEIEKNRKKYHTRISKGRSMPSETVQPREIPALPGHLGGRDHDLPHDSSQVDVTGKCLSGPVLEAGDHGDVLRLPRSREEEGRGDFGAIADEQRLVKPYDRPVYEVKNDGSDVLARV
jgi:hypothetical protein